MQILETTFTVSDNGSLKIPATVLKEMGLLAGDHIHVAYVVKDGRQNVFQEFLLSADPLDTLTEDNKFQVPSDLLAQANIPENADLQILCLNGYLLICQDSALSLNELSSVFESLRTAEDIVSSLPIDSFQAMEQLQEFTDRFEEGAPEDEES